MFCIPHTTLSCPSLSSKKVTTTQTTKTTFLSYSQKCCPRLSLVVVKKYDNTNNKDNISISKSVVQGCPSLSSKKVTTTKTTFLFPKSVVQGCPSLSSKKHDNIDNKDNISILFQKCCPRLSLVVVKKTRQNKQQRQHFFLIPKVLSKVVPRCRQKNHLFMKIFIFVSENIKMFCLGNISLSLKSTIRFFLIRISPIQCVKERDGGLRSGSINDGLFHLLMLGNVWVKSD